MAWHCIGRSIMYIMLNDHIIGIFYRRSTEFTFQFLQLQAQNFLLRVCQRCTYYSINWRAPFRCFPHVKTLPVFYQHCTEVFTDSSAALLRKLHDLESDFLKQLMMFMLISSFVTNLQNICGSVGGIDALVELEYSTVVSKSYWIGQWDLYM